MLEAAHDLNLVMTVVPVTAIIVVLVLFQRSRNAVPSRRFSGYGLRVAIVGVGIDLVSVPDFASRSTVRAPCS